MVPAMQSWARCIGRCGRCGGGGGCFTAPVQASPKVGDALAENLRRLERGAGAGCGTRVVRGDCCLASGGDKDMGPEGFATCFLDLGQNLTCFFCLYLPHVFWIDFRRSKAKVFCLF